jgi:NADH-quinone oxidoreductase subunit G
MATIYIDNQPYEVKDGQNLLQASLSLGKNLPYFCWHPALGSVGACRQCAVKQFKDEHDTRGRLVMACQTPAKDGTRFSIDDPEAAAFRASVIEWLMVNHPHDCPVCDEGGECHLQDMTVMTGHDVREYPFNKRTHRNQDLGPFVNHEMNRCIACYRCVRFYRDYAGGRDFNVFAAHDHVYFGRYEDGTLENEFSGNLVEVCPTGVFTDKTLKHHYTRKWDLQTAPSLCTLCGLGCNTIPGERYGELRRIRNRYNGAVNGYFLCDRGRYGYEFVNSDQRIRVPRLRDGGHVLAEFVSKDAVMARIASLFAENSRMIGIGSPRASLESNFALRQLVGPDHFYLGLSAREYQLLDTVLKIMRDGPAHTPTLRETSLADAVFILGEDVTNTAPMLALSLRQAVRGRPIQIAEDRLNIEAWEDSAIREAIQQQEGPFMIAAQTHTKLDDIATQLFHGAPDDLARLGLAVAHALNPHAPDVSDLPEEACEVADKIAQTLREAKRPLIVSGTGCGCESILEAAANIAWALCEDERPADLVLVVPEANSLGLEMIGGGDLAAAFDALQNDQADTVIVLENDLYRRADAAAVDAALNAAQHVILIDHLFTNATAAHADIVLPAAAWAETDGTLVNNEGRAQRFYQVFVPQDDIQSSWRWLRDMMSAGGRLAPDAWLTWEAVLDDLVGALPVFAPLAEIAPPAGFRIGGQKIPRQPARYTGRTAMHANVNVSEPKPPDDPDTPFSFSMEGYEGEPPAPLIQRYWAPHWNSVQALNRFQEEIAGPLRGGDPGTRLIEPVPGAKIPYFDNIPAPFELPRGRWLVVPIHHIFGSEELSLLTPGIAERTPQPYVALNPAEAARLKLAEGDQAALEIGGTSYHLPLVFVPALADGVAGLPLGLPGIAYVDLPAEGVLVKEKEAAHE